MEATASGFLQELVHIDIIVYLDGAQLTAQFQNPLIRPSLKVGEAAISWVCAIFHLVFRTFGGFPNFRHDDFLLQRC